MVNSNWIAIFKNPKVLLLIFLTLFCIFWVYLNGGPFEGGLKFGIDFSGGLRIPILLSNPVDQITMQQLIENLKTRTSTFGLTEVKFTPVGDSEVHLEVSKLNKDLVLNIEQILSHQGVFEAIVDKKVVLKGEDIYLDTVRQLNPIYYPGKDWVVGFSLTKTGQQNFAIGVKGKANYPIYMFLDRPKNAIIVLSKSIINQSIFEYNQQNKRNQLTIDEGELIKAIFEITNAENSNIYLLFEEDLEQNLDNIDLSKYPLVNKIVILPSNSSQKIIDFFKNNNYKIITKDPKDFILSFEVLDVKDSQALLYLTRWDVLGLRSAAILSPDVTTGYGTGSYVITGVGRGVGNEKIIDAQTKSKELVSVLKGGALPVEVSLGSIQEVPAVFGQEILKLSLLGLAIAILFISIFVALRYQKLQIVIPIIFVSICEMIILTTIIGAFSIDLGAMAGIIAATGISVDAQIVITDNLLKRKTDKKESLKYSYNIILANATIAILAFLPLVLFSGLVEIIGFGSTTILGYLLGVLISRPAYSEIISYLL
jgi:preprotein translocase subunit SecD